MSDEPEKLTWRMIPFLFPQNRFAFYVLRRFELIKSATKSANQSAIANQKSEII
jgi:hypothetical protein